MATPQADWLIRGVAQGAGWKLERGSLWRPPISVRRNTLTAPQRHGAVAVGLPVFDEPVLSLDFFIAKSGQAAVEAAVNDLIALLAGPSLIVTRVSGGLSLAAAAALVALNPDTLYYGKGAKARATLAVPGVFFRPAVATLDPGASNFTDFNFSALAAGNAPVPDAIARWTGPGTAANVSDTISGTGLSWSGSAVAAGSYLYLDAANLQAWVSTSASQWTKGGTDVSGGLSYPVAGPLQVWPMMSASDPAVRTTKVTVTGSGGWTGFALRAAASYL